MKYKFIGLGLILLLLVAFFYYYQTRPSKQVEWGLDFSATKAQALGLDWRIVYLDMLADLHPKFIRVDADSEQIMNEMILEADKQKVEIIKARDSQDMFKLEPIKFSRVFGYYKIPLVFWGLPKSQVALLQTLPPPLVNPKMFKDNIEFAQKVGIKEIYISEVESWYWMAKKQSDWGMWEAAKDLLD